MEPDPASIEAVLTEIPRWRGGSRLSEAGRLLWDVLFDADEDDEGWMNADDVLEEFARRVDRKLGIPGHLIRAYNSNARATGTTRLLRASDRSSSLEAARWWARRALGKWTRVKYVGSRVRVIDYPNTDGGAYTPERRAELRAESLAGHREISRRDAFAVAVRGRSADELAEIMYLVAIRLVRGTDGKPARDGVATLRLRHDRLVRPFIDAFEKRTDPSDLDAELLRGLIDAWQNAKQETDHHRPVE